VQIIKCRNTSSKGTRTWITWGSDTSYHVGVLNGRTFVPEGGKCRMHHGAYSASQVFAKAPKAVGSHCTSCWIPPLSRSSAARGELHHPGSELLETRCRVAPEYPGRGWRREVQPLGSLSADIDSLTLSACGEVRYHAVPGEEGARRVSEKVARNGLLCHRRP